MNTQPKPSSEARVATSMPKRYLGQLCKHFQHKLPVQLEEQHGSISFQGGTCTLEAEPETLVMRLTADDETELTRLEGVVARHLERFAFRDVPEIRWVRTP